MGSRSEWSLHRVMPVLAPSVIGGIFWALGWSTRAIVLWVIAALTAVLVLAGVPVDRYLARFAAAIAHGVGVVATVLVGLLLVAAGAVVRLFGRDPLVPRSQRSPGWLAAPAGADSDRLATATFGLERPGSGATPGGGLRAAGRGLALAVGAVALLVIVDLGVGLAWEQVSPEDPPLPAVVDRVNFTGKTDTVPDVRAESPAMSQYPWADEYLRELQMTPNGYWPFVETRPLEFKGKYVTVEGWSRRTYVPASLPEDAPVVWMFGGSTTWGEGQRDEYTIASYLARIAEDAGTPIRVVNYGQRGWTHFQEMLLFEQLLAEGPPPDVAVFYDGANEITTQTLGAKGVPSHTLVDQYAELISGGISEEFAPDEPPPTPPSNARLAWDAYLEHSAIQKLGRTLRDQFDPPAGASEAAATQDGDDGKAGHGQVYNKTVEDAARALDVYERGRAMTGFLAEEYDVEPVFFWQPVRTGPADVWANARVSEPTINISDALDGHQEVFIDGGHTNEVGARLVAERIWESLSSKVSGPGRGSATRRPPEPPSTTTSTASTTSTTVAEMSNGEMLDAASAELERAGSDACSLVTWTGWMDRMKVAGPEERARFAVIAQRFLQQLVGLTGADNVGSAQVVQGFAAQLPSMLETITIDPNVAAGSQLASVIDPASGYPQAVAELSISLDVRCSAAGGTP